MLGTAQHRQDAGRAGAVLALALPDSPSQQHLQPCPGAEHKGPEAAPQKQGLCEGSLPRLWAVPWAQGQALPSLMRPGARAPTRCRQRQWNGQAVGSSS